MSQYNVFLASPKGEASSVTEAAYQTVYHRFCKAVPHAKVTVVRSAEEFEKTFKQHGGWDGWTTYVATGVDYEFRTPIFNAIVCTSEKVGKATSDIVTKALENRRMVALVTGETISQVTGVQVIDSDNWQTGWQLTIAS